MVYSSKNGLLDPVEFCFLDEVGVVRGAWQKARAKNLKTVHVLMKRFNKI